MAKAFADMQNGIAKQMPLTDMQGKRLSNVGAPLAPDDAVTLKYLQSNQLPPQPAAIRVGTNTVGSSGGAWFREIPTGIINGTNNLFTLQNLPSPRSSVQLFLNGVAQDPYAPDFFVGGPNGKRISYAVPPKLTDRHFVIYQLGPAVAVRPGAFTFDVYNTGVYDNYQLSQVQVQELHWLMPVSGDTSVNPGPYCFVGTTGAGRISAAGAQWVSCAPTGTETASGTWTYTNVFDLSGYGTAGANIWGNLAGDYQASLYLNGNFILTVGNLSLTVPGYTALTTFTCSSTWFVPGLNTFTAVVLNDSRVAPNDSGVLIQFTSNTATAT